MTTNPVWSGTSIAVLPSAAHQVRARSATPSASAAGRQSSISSIRATGLNTCRPKNRSAQSLRSPSSPIDSDEVVVARSASGAIPASALSSVDLGVGVLRDRLDHQVAVGEVGSLRGDLDPLRRAAVELARLTLRHLLRPPRGGVAAGEQAHGPGLGRARGEAARDHPAAGDRRALVCLGPSHRAGYYHARLIADD